MHTTDTLTLTVVMTTRLTRTLRMQATTTRPTHINLIQAMTSRATRLTHTVLMKEKTMQVTHISLTEAMIIQTMFIPTT